jgi:hypothetical protein
VYQRVNRPVSAAEPDTADPGAGPHSDILRLQTLSGNQAVSRMLAPAPLAVQRFGSDEHVTIGKGSNWAGETVEIDLGGGDKLSYPDMIALAGDLFASVQQIQELARTPAGQDELKFARWWKLDGNPANKPALTDPSAETRVRDRYNTLAAENMSHFAAGGQALGSYRLGHEAAMNEAFLYGATGDVKHWNQAKTEEAFSHHFLTDSFSAGHIRTPRQDIKEWYTQNYPNATGAFLDYMAEFIVDRLHAHADDAHSPIVHDGVTTEELPNSLLVWVGRVDLKGEVKKKIVEKVGQSAVDAYSLGDLVSKAFHDEDNKGLAVMSDFDSAGNPVAGGYIWPAKDVGDGLLNQSPMTLHMVTQAVNRSIAELETARQAGQTFSGGRSRPDTETWAAAASTRLLYDPYRAEGYIPRPLPPEMSVQDAPQPNESMEWRWDRMNEKMTKALDDLVKTFLAAEIGDKTPSGPDFKDKYHLHTEKAIPEFAAHLKAQGINVLRAVVARSQ